MGPARPFTKDMVNDLRRILKAEGRYRDLALLCVHVDSCLRSVDVLSLRVGDVRDIFHIKQKKTGRSVECRLFQDAKEAIRLHLMERPSVGKLDYLFPGQGDKPLTTRRYRALTKDWVALLRQSDPKWRARLDPMSFSTHSLRKARPSHLYLETGNAQACQHLLGHSKMSHTERYLGVEVHQAHELAEQHPF